LRITIVRAHLASKGFTTFHDETDHHDDSTHPSVNINDDDESEFNNIVEMVVDAAGPQFDWIPNKEPPNNVAKEIYQMLNDSEEPLWEVTDPRSADISKLCVVTELLNLKADYHLQQSYVNRIISIMKKTLPTNNKLPKDFYRCKKMVKMLEMAYEKIHVCPNNCMLYYGPNRDKTMCDDCNYPRYK
jgi:hypothetical protein